MNVKDVFNCVSEVFGICPNYLRSGGLRDDRRLYRAVSMYFYIAKMLNVDMKEAALFIHRRPIKYNMPISELSSPEWLKIKSILGNERKMENEKVYKSESGWFVIYDNCRYDILDVSSCFGQSFLVLKDFEPIHIYSSMKQAVQCALCRM